MAKDERPTQKADNVTNLLTKTSHSKSATGKNAACS